jgi:predicted ATPase
MQIARLLMKNFNGFDYRELKFHPQFNLLAGDNATGKSSVLDALAIGAGSWFLGLPGIAKCAYLDTSIRIALHLKNSSPPASNAAAS